jgi:hypothetical protein
MSPRRGTAESGGGGGRAAVTVIAVAVVAIGMLLLVRARPKPDAFDPRSARSDGARALVLLLEGRGATVDVTREVPTAGSEARILVLSDRLGDDQRLALLDFVEAGGLAVVADPASSLHGGPGTDGGSVEVSDDSALSTGVGDAESEADLVLEPCTIPALQHLRGLYVRSGLLFPVAPDEQHCFGQPGDDDHAFAIRRRLGEGTVVGLGDNRLFTNQYLRYADNSGLAVALLAPSDGRVVMLLGDEAPATPDDLGSGEDTLGDLVRPSVWMAFAELALAFAVFALARGVRAGRFVDEPLPSPLAGSDFVHARASLMQRARHAQAAGDVLRGDLYRHLCRTLRLPPNTDVERVVAAAAVRGLDPQQVRIALTSTTPTDSDLRDLADLHARLRNDLVVATEHPAEALSEGALR